MADPQTIAAAFVKYYYETFDSGNREALRPLYRPTSMLTWETSQILGDVGIAEKLTGLPFQKVVHNVVTLDPQPSNYNGAASLLVLVTGQLKVDEGENVIPFSQLFQLVPEGTTYYVQNDVFRLNYG